MFGGVKLTKNAAPDKYSYSGYGIGFETRGQYSLSDDSVGKYVIIFEVDMSSSVHIDNRGKDILILGKGPTQGLNHTLSAETLYSINFTRLGKNFCLNLHDMIMGATVSYLLMLQNNNVNATKQKTRK